MDWFVIAYLSIGASVARLFAMRNLKAGRCRNHLAIGITFVFWPVLVVLTLLVLGCAVNAARIINHTQVISDRQ